VRRVDVDAEDATLSVVLSYIVRETQAERVDTFTGNAQ
jgi:hypothetical protein